MRVNLAFAIRYCSFRANLKSARGGFLTDGEMLLDMLQDRNKTSHIYDENTAKYIFEMVRGKSIKAFKINIQIFEKYLLNEENTRRE